MRLTLWTVAIGCVGSVASLGGCAGGVSGEIDGDGVPSFTTAAVGEFDAGNGDALLGIWSSAGDACVDGTEHIKIQKDADTQKEYAEDIEKYDKEHLPEEYWVALVSVFAEDIDDLEEEQEIELDDFDDDLYAGLTICHIKDYPEEKNGFLDTDQDCFAANEGTIFVQYNHEGTLRVSTDGDDLIEVDEVDGNDDGEDLSFGGSAGYCEDLADELDD